MRVSLHPEVFEEMMGLLLVMLMQPPGRAAAVPPVAAALYRDLNQERAAHGLPPLHWDQSLCAAAESHLAWQLRSRELSHQFDGEPDLAERAARAGAHLSVVAENLALGPDAVAIHSGWLRSVHHRENMLDPRMDAVGFAVAETARGFVVVEDFGRRVEALTPEGIEARVSQLLAEQGAEVSSDRGTAREVCALADGVPRGSHPRFVMRWQSSDLSRLPDVLVRHLQDAPGSVASVGACRPQGAENFTTYRIAVLLN